MSSIWINTKYRWLLFYTSRTFVKLGISPKLHNASQFTQYKDACGVYPGKPRKLWPMRPGFDPSKPCPLSTTNFWLRIKLQILIALIYYSLSLPTIKKGNTPLLFLLLDSLSKLSHLWMVVACMSWPTDLLGNFPEWTQHRWCKACLTQSVNTAYCHLLLHTTMILQCSSIEHSWLACGHFVQRKMWYLCQGYIDCPFLTLHPGTLLWNISFYIYCAKLVFTSWLICSLLK